MNSKPSVSQTSKKQDQTGHSSTSVADYCKNSSRRVAKIFDFYPRRPSKKPTNVPLFSDKEHVIASSKLMPSKDSSKKDGPLVDTKCKALQPNVTSISDEVTSDDIPLVDKKRKAPPNINVKLTPTEATKEDVSLVDKKRKASPSYVTPTTVKKEKSPPIGVIDLTGFSNEKHEVIDLQFSESEKEDTELVKPTVRSSTYEEIKRENKLFFTYDPAGVESGEILPDGYCVHCRCPSLYCSNIVLGRDCLHHMEFLLYRCHGSSSIHDTSTLGLKETFAEVYTDALNAKRRANAIYFDHGFKISRNYIVPYCVRRGYRKRFLSNVRKEEQYEYDVLFNGDLDISNEELENMSACKEE